MENLQRWVAQVEIVLNTLISERTPILETLKETRDHFLKIFQTLQQVGVTTEEHANFLQKLHQGCIQLENTVKTTQQDQLLHTQQLAYVQDNQERLDQLENTVGEWKTHLDAVPQNLQELFQKVENVQMGLLQETSLRLAHNAWVEEEFSKIAQLAHPQPPPWGGGTGPDF